MLIKSIQLKDFKRFNNLTIDLGDTPKRIVALVGPNGSGKSSVFDGLEAFSTDQRERRQRMGYRKDISYYIKSLYQLLKATPTQEDEAKDFESSKHIFVKSDQDSYTSTSFYIRSAHRFTPRISVTEIKELSKIENDESRPKQLIDEDKRLEENYERLIGKFFDEIYGKNITGEKWEKEHIQNLNNSLKEVLNIRIVSLGNPTKKEGTLYFEKGSSTKVPYENLSAGEKEVVDLILDIYIKKDFYTNTVICIDEPELHLHTAVQRKLLNELEKIIPENCQIWVATHSIGFLRALQEDLKDKSSVIDFLDRDFDSVVTLKPIRGTREDWARIFQTALEDLTGLLAPKRIFYCEGKPAPSSWGKEQGLDAEVYNEIFSTEYPDTLFVSSGGGNEINKNALLALKIQKKAFNLVGLFLLKDRDELSDENRGKALAVDSTKKILLRREIENYIFDKEILKKFCDDKSINFDEKKYNSLINDINSQDLKPIQQQIQSICQSNESISEFKKSLSKFIIPETSVYKELKSCIFNTFV